MEDKTTYEFCILCGPEDDAPVDAEWETVICRKCVYTESRDYTDELVTYE